MKAPDFEMFLVDRHADQYLGLDDEMVDDCEDWIANLDVCEWIKFANAYACEYGKLVVEECQKIVAK